MTTIFNRPELGNTNNPDPQKNQNGLAGDPLPNLPAAAATSVVPSAPGFLSGTGPAGASSLPHVPVGLPGENAPATTARPTSELPQHPTGDAGSGTSALTALRCRLRAGGFSPLPVYGKVPAPKAWEKLTDTNAEQIALWELVFPRARNTGVQTARAPGLDIDIWNPDAAGAVEQLARDRFGDDSTFLVRFGRSPKRAILLRTDTPFSKITANFIAPDGSEGQKIEVLADGQQLVVFGIHPETKRPYTWHGGEPGQIKFEDLPHITEAEARAFVADAVELLVTEHGYTLASERPKTKANGQDGNSGGKDDWAWLLANIREGREIHDSVRDLAAKLIASGMGAAAATNFLRAQFEQSTAPRDHRWKDRYNDIPRAVASAEAKFGGQKEGEAQSESEEKVKSSPQRDTHPIVKSSAAFVAGFIPPEYVVVGLLQRRFFYSLTGQTGAGKTAIMLLLVASAALGLSFAGRETKKIRVLYLAAENADDVRMRWVALAQHMGFDINTIEVYFVEGRFKLSKSLKVLRAEAEKHGGEFGLVIVDTGPTFFEGKEENENKQLGDHACLLRSLVDTIPGGPCVVANCHPVKNATADQLIPRGGGSFLAETDGNLTVNKTDSTVEFHWQGKFRGPDFAPMNFLIRTVTHQDLKDSDGRLIPTVIAEHISEQAKEDISAAARTAEIAVLKIIDANPAATLATIAAAMRWTLYSGEPNKMKAHRCVKALTTAKLIKEARRSGRYLLTDEGKKILKEEAQ
jgi:hypothetical protein